MNTSLITNKNILFVFLSKSKITLFFAVLFSFLYLSILGNFILNEKLFYQHLMLYISISIFILFLLTLFLYKKNYFNLLQLIINEEYQNYEKVIINKYSKFIDPDFFLKLKNLETLLDKRFEKTGIFNSRVKSLLNESLKMYINNLSLINDIHSLLINNPLINKTEEIAALKDNNKQIILNIDTFIKEIIIESRENLEIETLVKEFEKNIQIFNTLKEIKKTHLGKDN